MKNRSFKSIVCGLFVFLIMFASCTSLAEQAEKTVLFENDLLKIVYNGTCTVEDLSDMFQFETYGLDMDTFQFESFGMDMDFSPTAHLEVVIENKSSLDLAVRLEGGSINGWTIDPNYSSFAYGDVNKNSKLKTTLDLYNTDFLYEIYKPEDLETIQLNLVIYENRPTSLCVLGHVSSDMVQLNADK